MSEIIEEQALKALHSVLDARIPKVRLLNLVQGELKANNTCEMVCQNLVHYAEGG